MLLSWQLDTPSSLEFSVQLWQQGKELCPPLTLFHWGPNTKLSYSPKHTTVSVDCDVVQSSSPFDEVTIEVRGEITNPGLLTLCCQAALSWKETERSAAWGRDIEVPERSQRTLPTEHAHRLCSPSSLGMLMDYWGEKQESLDIARAVHDQGPDIFGNWSFNASHAAASGLFSAALWLDSVPRLESFIAAGIPLALSHSFKEGHLAASPLPATTGHLIVLRGLTQQGDFIVNDPAADPRKGEAIKRVYPRKALLESWKGLVYVLAKDVEQVLALLDG